MKSLYGGVSKRERFKLYNVSLQWILFYNMLFFFSRKLVSNTSVLLKIIKSKILIIGGLKKMYNPIYIFHRWSNNGSMLLRNVQIYINTRTFHV